MKLDEVPQDQKNFKDGSNAPKRVVYVTGDDGTYGTSTSVGWEPENFALEQAWEDIDFQLEDRRVKVLIGELSPIAYFMVKHRMDIATLAAHVNKWQWQVKRHMKPSVFKKLSRPTLASYAMTFDMTIDDLIQFKIK